MAVVLTKYVRTLRGGSQPHLMQADDGNFYMVKFQGNPQGTRILANELLACKLAQFLGLPVPVTMLVRLPFELSKELYFETPTGRESIRPGLHLGSRLVIRSLEGRCYDVLPQSSIHLIRNTGDLAGIRLFDLWTCNRDIRQLLFWKYSQNKKYNVTLIDNGHCFGGPEWDFGSLKLLNTALTEDPTSQAYFRWADRIARFPIRGFERAVTDLVPPEWCGKGLSLATVCEELRIRQSVIAPDPTSRTFSLSSQRLRSSGCSASTIFNMLRTQPS